MGVKIHTARPTASLTDWLTAIRQWGYAVPGKRDLRIDFLRGFAVFAMVVDHIGGESPLYLLTGGNRFFVSAAEGFVFISGLMVGLVYKGELARGGLRAATVKALKRAWTLYTLSVWLALGFAAVSALLGLAWAPDFTSGGWVDFVLGVVTAHRTFYLVDVMLLYTFLLALTPLMLWALQRGWTWELLCASYGLWYAYQLFPDRLRLPWPVADSPVFNLAAWQILFVVGLVIGFHRQRVGEWFARRLPPPPLPGGWLLPLGVGVAGLVWLHATGGAALDPIAPARDGGILLDEWFDKSALPLPRLLAAALVFAFAWSLTTRLWVPLAHLAGPVLRPLGEKALYAYAAHLFIVAGVQFLTLKLVFATLPRGAPGPDEAAAVHASLPPLLNAALQIGGIALLWWLTRHRVLYQAVLPLGDPPLALRAVRGRRLPCPTVSLIAVAVLAVVASGGLLFSPKSWASPPAAGELAAQGPTAATRPRVVGTVTAPRRVGAPRAAAPGAAPAAAGVSAAAGAEAPAGGEAVPARVEPAPGEVILPGQLPVELAGQLSDEEFYSEALGRTMPFGLYLPPGYDTSERNYPVLYMLHGAGGHYSEWVDFGLINAADRLIAAGQIQPLIIVLPQGDQSYWINWANDGPRWADYVAIDLVDHIDANYRTIKHRRARAIGGLSMGGYGALSIAFNYMDRFAVAGAHSPSLRTFEQAQELPFFGDAEHFARTDPLTLALQAPRRRLAIWLDVGEEDQWRPRVEELHAAFHERGLAHDYRVLPGEHEYTYWIANVDDYIRFYAENLRGE